MLKMIRPQATLGRCRISIFKRRRLTGSMMPSVTYRSISLSSHLMCFS
jgi:hypothetical protein